MALVWLLFAPVVAGAVTIDDFAVPFAGALSSSGTTTTTQSPIAVFGGTRTATVATFGIQPTVADTIANPSPPPVTDILSSVLGSDAGGRVEVEYPQSPAADLTFGVTTGSVIEVRSTLSVGGGSVIVELADLGGTVVAASRTSVDFSGPGEVDYLFFLDENTFPGVDFENVSSIATRVETTFGADFDVSNIEALALSPETIEWGDGIALQSASGFVNPAVLVGFNPQPEPPPNLDLSDPRVAVLSFPGFPPEPVRIGLASYGTTHIVPAIVVDSGHVDVALTNAESFTVRIGAMGPGGEPIDPGSLVGFNPQPEPPPGSLVGFNPQPEPPPDPGLLGFGFQFEAGGGGALAALAADAESWTVTIEILDETGDPVALRQVQGVALPGLGPVGSSVLVAVLASLGAFGITRARTS